MKTKLAVLLLGLLMTGINFVQAQVTIGSGQAPNKNAVLELISNDSKGLLLPRLELTEASEPAPLAEHVAGMVVYNTGDQILQGYYYNDGTRWILISDTNSSPWRNIETGEPAESATENIYQNAQVSIGATTVNANAQLDVFSTTKGVLLPRMTTLQRDAIVAPLADGLLIYNITTGCYNYYQSIAAKWLSLCGTYDPAKFVFLSCEGGPSMAGSGGLTTGLVAGTPLTSLNTYTITVRVSEPGTYQVLLSTTNGYSYSKEGVFTETGTYTLDLEGQGTPAHEAMGANANLPTATFNGQTVTPDGCTLPTIEVEAAAARYTFDCGSAVVYGEYNKGSSVNNSNYVEVNITVTNSGTTTIETDFANGMRFSSGSVNLTSATTSVKLYAQGSPVNTGSYDYMLTGVTSSGNVTCTFPVVATSDLGNFTNPAKSCRAILADDKTKTDGDYWIQLESGSSTPVKTKCDMTRGGYTLVWSYSEYTARNFYGRASMRGNEMSIWGTASDMNMQLSANNVRNVISTNGANDTIKYEDFRLSRNTMLNLQENKMSKYIVRIMYDPRNLNDPWGEENHMVISPVSTTYDLVNSTGAYTFSGATYVPTTGKMFGLAYKTTSGTAFTYETTPGGSATTYGTGSAFYFGSAYTYGNHWDVAGNITGTRTNIPVTKGDGTTTNITFNPAYYNNIFGFFDESMTTHHFGKCVSGVLVSAGSRPSTSQQATIDGVDDYAFTTSGSSMVTCESEYKYPHSFNWNSKVSPARFEGRFLQWWMY